jgi:hypothetical protein
MELGQWALILGVGAFLLVVVVAAWFFGRRRSAGAAGAEDAGTVNEEALTARKAAYRQGIIVLVGLAVLTALEFLVAGVLGGSVVFLFVLILAKAGLILQNYMHLDHVWSEEEAH